ncbi:MAG: shikimate dehydrogenase [Armatimonadetes bacterium]|nr:shikimate dehydrogenase [Armatimonadota bacterium]
MHRFAFVIHPIKPKDAARKYPIAKYMPDWLIEKFYGRKKPFIGSYVKGVESKTGAKTEGLFIICPLTPDMMLHKLPLDAVYEKLIYCSELAKSEGAEIMGLGAFTSVVGDGGVTVAKNSPIAITTGNSYTIATAIQGALKACDIIGVRPESSVLAVVGATGSIGRTCARMLSPHFSRSIVVGRDPERTQAVADECARAEASVDVASIKAADLVITVTSAGADLIFPEHLKPGAIICDVARPRDVSVKVAKERPDVLVIEGGVVAVPGNVDFGMSFGFPPKTAYACMSETMMLALEGKIENFTLGKDVSVEQVEETIRLADKHGFELAGFRSFERAVEEEAFERARTALMGRGLGVGA